MNVRYANKNAIRNKPCTDTLVAEISKAIYYVYGPGYYAKIYSGGQDKIYEGTRRTGTIRHDEGKAADIYIISPHGNKISGAKLAPIAQYWSAMKIGGVGIEMRVGGVHLDEWSPPPPRGGMFWYYPYNKNSSARRTQRAAVIAGLKGVMPPRYAGWSPQANYPKNTTHVGETTQSPWAALFTAIAGLFRITKG